MKSSIENMKSAGAVKAAYTLLLLGLAGSVHADFVGLFASADYWQTSGSANLAEHGSTAQPFDLSNKGQPSFQVAFDHPVPIIPNVRIRHGQLDFDGSANALNFVFNGTTYNTGTTTITSHLTNTDATLYYRLLDNVVKAYAGINAKLIKGDVTATNSNSSTPNTVTLNQVVPMLYISAGGKLPFTGVSAKAEVSMLKYKDSNVSDMSAEVKYDFIDNVAVDVGVKAGFRQLKLDLVDVENTDANVTINGPFLGLEAHF